MNLVMKERGWTPATWARLARVAPSTIQKAIKPSYAFITSSRTLAKLAAAADWPAPEVGAIRDSHVAPRFLPVRYRVEAGSWLEVDGQSQVPPSQHTFPVTPDPRYERWPQWLEEVVGDSINLKIAPGGFAHVVDAIQMGYSARDGDYVVVERRRNGGHLRERTIKQVVVNGGGIELWPRSSNPHWSGPITINAGVKEGEEIEVEIVGLVIGSYFPFLG